MNNRYQHDVCIVGGAGHIGLPLALVFAHKKQKTLIMDINLEALDLISQGKMPFMEDDAEPLLREVLQSGKLTLTSDLAQISSARNLIITIGTPVDEFQNPIYKDMRRFADSITPYINEDQLLILRSTLYPGITEWLYTYLLKNGKRIKLAFCPERLVQGKGIKEIQTLPQIVSGVTPEAETEASALFGLIAPEIVLLKPLEAEFAKLITNAYRYIQFAAANQFYMITTAAGVDYQRVLEGLKQNYPRSRDLPIAGFAAGPCLYKDTMQLSAFSNNQFMLGHSAMLVNEGLALFVVDMLKKKFNLCEMKIGLLGMAFKANTDDIRSSLSYKLKKILELQAEEVLTTDPYVQVDPALLPYDEVLERSDLLILCVPHDIYRDLDLKGKPFVDVWGFWGCGTLI